MGWSPFDEELLRIITDDAIDIAYLSVDYHTIIDKYYRPGTKVRDIILSHSSSVGELALEISHSNSLGLDDDIVKTGAMLHDIGIVLTDAPGIDCRGSAPYLCHGLLGARLLLDEGAPLWVARIAARHTGAGLTAREIKAEGLPLPCIDLLPETLLEKLICYADKFYSKSGNMQRKSIERVRASMERYGSESLARFNHLDRIFRNCPAQ